MKIKFSKQQIQILIVLHFVIAILFVGIIFLNPKTPAPPVNAVPGDETPSYIHDKYRNPRIAFSENIAFEINLGGSGDETVENTYPVDPRLFIVGKTVSSDYDFDESGGKNIFVIETDENAKPVKYRFFDGELLFSRFDGINPDSILLFVKQGAKNVIIDVSLTGSDSSVKELPFLSSNEKIVDAFPDMEGEKLILMVELNQTVPPQKKLRIVVLKPDFTKLSDATMPSPFDLEYIGAYPDFDCGYVIAVNVKSQNTAAMILFEWNSGSPKIYKECAIGRKYQTLKFLPSETGYAALIMDDGGVCDILQISRTKTLSVVLLEAPPSLSGDMFFDGESYYIYLYSQNGIGYMSKFNPSFSSRADIDPFSYFVSVTAFSAYQGFTYFGGAHTDKSVLSVTMPSGTLFETAFCAATEKIINIIPFDDYVMLILESTGTSIDVGKNFGGKDVLILKLPF